MVISFCNQKGGCGKTTLATAFSFYLSNKGHIVTVFDTDDQQSLFQMHLMDKSHFGNDFLFSVQYVGMDDKKKVDEIFSEYQAETDRVAIIDSSGVLDFKNLELASRADKIIVPFSFDQKTFSSTLTWLKAYTHFQFDAGKIIVLANRIKSTIKKDGLIKAKELIVDGGFFVCENNIPDVNSINMLTTFQMDKQTGVRMVDAFNEMYSVIFR